MVKINTSPKSLKKFTFLVAMLLFIFPNFWINSAEIFYKGQTKSQIDWKNLEPKAWLDLNYWKREQAYKRKFPEWANAERDKNNLEEVGRLIKCIGTCINERHDGAFKVGFYSKIYETNELRTEKNSYAWVFLLDGTLVRLAPESSLTFNEFNLSDNEFFVYSRINYGNIYWLSRTKEKIDLQKLRETDSLFSVLEVFGSDEWLNNRKMVDENNLYASLTKQDNTLQYKMLNELIEKNNTWATKPTKYILSMPNGLITGDNISMEFVVLLGNKTYLRQVSQKVYSQEITEVPEATLIKLGFDEVEKRVFTPDTWFELDFKGKAYSGYKGDDKDFVIPELVLKRIPTILTARELWLKKFSPELHHQGLKEDSLRKNYGFRLWKNYDDEKGDLYQRYQYLLGFIRKMESHSIAAYGNYIEEAKKDGYPVKIMQYGRYFFDRAISNYSVRKETDYWGMSRSDRKVLNSTKRKFWRIIHEKGK